ncbi:hypothetical protein V8D89_009697 [Ganoderma adspersum]
MSSGHSPPSRDKSPPPEETKQSHLPLYQHYYTDGWEVLYNTSTPTHRDENNPWCAFWYEWWGANSSGKVRLERAAREDPKTTSPHRILTVTQDAVWRTLKTLEDSKGSILLREEYTSLYDRAFAPFKGYHCPGVLVKGQPGIGKSYFLVYTLLRRIGEGKPVLFSTSAGSTLLFDQHGVRHMRTDEVNSQHLPPTDLHVHNTRTWSLIDASVSSDAEDSKCVHPGTFVVCAAPPRVAEHKTRVGREYPLRFVMQPWSVRELGWLLSVDGLTPLGQDQRARYTEQPKSVQHLVQEIGPCPGDILSRISSPDKYEGRVRAALKGVWGVQDIRDLFWNADRDMMSRQARELLLLRRTHSKDVDDWPLVSFKSRDIALRVMPRVGYLGVDDAAELFEKNGRWPRSRALAQWVFESLVIGVISGSGTSLNCVLDTMFRTLPSESDQDALPPRPTKSRRIVPAREDISCMSLDEELCYHPIWRDNPVFDAFFVELTRDTVVVRLFKVAIPRKCVDSHDDALDMLAALLDRAKVYFGKPNARPEYVFFAPYTRRPNQSASTSAMWDISTRERWSEVKGDVQVYYIDVMSLGCDVHDLLECLPDCAESS